MKKSNSIPTQAGAATGAELQERYRKCWNSNCRLSAWLQDWAGWNYCLKHWYRSWRWGGGEVSLKSFLFELKYTKLRYPYKKL